MNQRASLRCLSLAQWHFTPVRQAGVFCCASYICVMTRPPVPRRPSWGATNNLSANKIALDMHHIWKRRSELNDCIRTVSELHRGTPSARGYDRAWNRIATQRREADEWLCQPCLIEGRITASNTVDHIIPIHVRPDWRLAFDNTQVICCCHRRKTNEDTMRYGSSESRAITQNQRCARDEALRMEIPPRCAA